MMTNAELLQASEAGRILGLSTQSVRTFALSGRLAYIQIPSGMRLYRREDVERLARERAAARSQHGDSVSAVA
jgi:DNA-binding transcriptional MerR regulator